MLLVQAEIAREAKDYARALAAYQQAIAYTNLKQVFSLIWPVLLMQFKLGHFQALQAWSAWLLRVADQEPDLVPADLLDRLGLLLKSGGQ